MVNRITIVRILFMAALAAFAAACQTAPPPAAAPPAEGQPRQVTLAIGGEDEAGYDPTLGWGRYGSPLFQSTLLRRNEQMEIVNDLAEDYTVSDDGLTWTVTIRSGVLFSDGEPLTAADVAYTFNTAAASGGMLDLGALDEAVAVDDTTVEFHLTQPQSTFIQRLISLGIVPEHAHGAAYARNPIGSGPYRLVQWDEGQQLIVEANPYYYGGPVAIERLVFLFVNEDTAFAAARAGEVHLVAVPQALAVQEIEGMTLHVVRSVDNRGLLFPFVPNEGALSPAGYPIGNDVTADLAIRRAVNYILDRDALVEGILEGFGTPAFGPASGLPWDEPSTVHEDGDLAQAQAILAEAGWVDVDGALEKDGVRAAFTIIYPASDSTRQGLALAAADMIRSLGIEVSVEGLSWDEINPAMHTNVVVFGWGSHDPAEIYSLYHSTKAGVESFNAGYYANEQVDAYLDLAMAAPSQEEAIAYWQAAQWDGETGFATPGDAAWAWMVNLDHTYFVDDCLDIGTPQIEPHGHGWPITANIDSWQWICE